MARKNLLKDLMSAPETKSAVTPRRAPKGAVGAVSDSIARLKSRSVTEVSTDLIEDDGLRDRLEYDAGDHAALVASIQTYGQQVPILLRPLPGPDERFGIVYGRRRVRALRELNIPAKALIQELDDRSAIMAQGQENSARKDLTFIEKTLFAVAMDEMDFDRRKICGALSIDKTVLSRMMSIHGTLGTPLIEAIGPADGIGRDRWMVLAKRFEQSGIDPSGMAKQLSKEPLSSVKRFEVLFATMGDTIAGLAGPPPQPEKRHYSGPDGRSLGKAVIDKDRVVITVDSARNRKFATWIGENFDEVYRMWERSTSGKTGPSEPDEQ